MRNKESAHKNIDDSKNYALKDSQTQPSTYYLIPFIRCSRKVKTTSRAVIPSEWRRKYLAKGYEETFYGDRNIFYYSG